MIKYSRIASLIIFVGPLFLLNSCGNSVESDSSEEITEQVSEIEHTTEVPSIEMVWESDTNLITNESVLYVPEKKQLIVSSINGTPLEQDGNGYLSILSLEGEILEHHWVTGLDAPKGMAYQDGKLYVTNIDELVEIDMESGDILARYPVANSVFLNDVSIGNGVVYFSDMKTGTLHMLSGGKLSVVEEHLENLNGLAYSNEDQGLYMLNAKGLQFYDQDGNISTINEELANGDGLILLEKDVFLLSRWVGELWILKNGEASMLLDTKEQVQTADIGYIPEEHLILVPRFFSNKVTAYRLSY